jgi:hypothetical protein
LFGPAWAADQAGDQQQAEQGERAHRQERDDVTVVRGGPGRQQIRGKRVVELFWPQPGLLGFLKPLLELQ